VEERTEEGVKERKERCLKEEWETEKERKEGD
jgi:hypothetical protein